MQARCKWFSFYDVASGGEHKLEWTSIYIEATDEAAAAYEFVRRFEESPYDVACSCCGRNYSVMDHEGDLREATAASRYCSHDGERYLEQPDQDRWPERYCTLAEYLAKPSVFVVNANGVVLSLQGAAEPAEPKTAGIAIDDGFCTCGGPATQSWISSSVGYVDVCTVCHREKRS